MRSAKEASELTNKKIEEKRARQLSFDEAIAFVDKEIGKKINDKKYMITLTSEYFSDDVTIANEMAAKVIVHLRELGYRVENKAKYHTGFIYMTIIWK